MSTVERPLRRDAERNRRLILDAAGEVFAERGLAVSLDEIARRAGLGVGTVYRRFPSRDALIDGLFEERVEAVVALVEDGLADPDPWRGLCRFLERSLEHQAADRGLKELLLGTDVGRHRIAQVREQMRPRVTELVRRAQEAGALRADFAPQDVPLIQMMVGAVVDATREVQPEVWRRYLALILDGMRGEDELTAPPIDMRELDSVMRCWRPPARS